jgi:hypothetical protein
VRLAFDANAAIDSLRPARPFPGPLKAARQLFMPLSVPFKSSIGDNGVPTRDHAVCATALRLAAHRRTDAETHQLIRLLARITVEDSAL